MKPKLALWGAGGHALAVAEIVRLCDEYELVGFLDDAHPERRGEAFCGATILGGPEQFVALHETGVIHLLIALGNCKARLHLAEVARVNDFQLASAIHPRAVIAADVTIGAGTVIKAGALIDPAVRIGENVIVSAGTTLAHGAVMEDGTRLSAGANLAGWSRIERGAWVGVGATISDRLTIGAWSIVGAGAVVVRDIPNGVVAYGVPARVVRDVNAEDV